MLDKLQLPPELIALRQWVCWRLEADKRTNRDAKVPYSPITTRRASPSNPETWGSLDEALSCAEKYLYSGIGFMFTVECGIIGIDIDHCLTDGQPNDIAADILAHLPPTYIEVSPSGTGLHIFLKGTLPSGGNRNSKSGVEIYSSSRYFTITGNQFQGSIHSIGTNSDGVLEFIHQKYVATGRISRKTSISQLCAVMPDDELLKLA